MLGLNGLRQTFRRHGRNDRPLNTHQFLQGVNNEIKTKCKSVVQPNQRDDSLAPLLLQIRTFWFELLEREA